MKEREDDSQVRAREAFGVREFCLAHSISRALLYKLWLDNRGPQYIQLGRKRLIPQAAARDWLREIGELSA